MKALFELLNRLSKWLEQWQRNQQAEELQHEQDQINDDAAQWFADHLGDGVLHNDASKAPKAESDSNQSS